MKRNLFLLVTVLCLLAATVLPVCAVSPRLVDDAGLLSGTQTSEIESRLNEISTRQGLDIVIVTVDSTNGSTPMEYADDYFDYHAYRADGILLLISMEDSDWWISTAGYGITAFTDAGIEYIGEKIVPLLSDGEYGEAFGTFADLCDEFITQAKSGDPYDSHNLPKEPFQPVLSFGISLISGLTAAFFGTGSMKSKLKTVNAQAKADDYVTPGSLQLSQSRDFHLYTHLNRIEKAQSSSGSSTHTSSSGTTHGGGGGKF